MTHKARYTLPVFTGRVYTAREHGRHFWHPCSRVVYTL